MTGSDRVCPVLSGNSSKNDIERVVEENRRLLSLMEEKDRRIDLLESKIEQLLKDKRA